MKRPRIKNNINTRLFDKCVEIYGSFKANEKYKLAMLRIELRSINNN